MKSIQRPVFMLHPVVHTHMLNKLCWRPPQYAPAPVTLTFELESGVRVTCDVDYLCANFSLPRPLCSRLRPDVRDRRQTDTRTSDSIIA